MKLEQRPHAMLQQHLSDQQFNSPTKVQLILEIWRYGDIDAAYIITYYSTTIARSEVSH